MFTTEILNEIGEKYNKPQLEKGFLPYVMEYYSRDIFIRQDKLLADILQKALAKKPVTKYELVYLCFSVFATKEIYSKFLLSLPPFIQLLIEKLLWVENMSETEIESLLGEPISIISTNSYEGKLLKNSFCFFSVNQRNTYYTYDKSPFILFLDPSFKKVLCDYYPKPLHYNLLWLDKIPSAKNNFNATDIIVQEMPRLISYQLQGAIKYSVGGRPTDATLAKLHRSCGITEIFPDKIERIGRLRTRLLAGILYSIKINHIGTDSVQILKERFKSQYLKLDSASFILSHLKGWGHLQAGDYKPNVEAHFYEIFKLLIVDKWISTQNFMDYIQFRNIDLNPVTNYACINRLYSEAVEISPYGYKEKTYVSTDMNVKVNFPFIKGTIFLLASLGMVEIACDNISENQLKNKNYFVYDSLNFFKLTALGAYILGLSENYIPAIVQQQNKLQFSEDSMMIIAEGEMSVLDLLLANFTEKAGANRYKVTSAQFLKDCKNLRDIEQKILLFKNVITTQLPAYWNQQFINWKLNSLKICVDVATTVFSIPSTEKELHKLLAQDTILKGLIFKAENFNIIVQSNNVLKFKSRMKEFGFLVE